MVRAWPIAGLVAASGLLATGLHAAGLLTAGALQDTWPVGRARVGIRTWSPDPISAGPSQATSGPIVIDGVFEEWNRVPVLVSDPMDAPGAAVDFGQVKAAHDDEAVYLLIDLGRALNAQAAPGAISLIFDTDANPRTGGEMSGLGGADLVVDLSPPYGVGGFPPGIGVGVRMATAAGAGATAQTGVPDGGETGASDGARAAFEPTDSYEVGFTYAPKFTSRMIELRLERSPVGAWSGFGDTGYSAKIVFTDSTGVVRDEVGPFNYRMASLRPRQAAAVDADPLARASPASFRVLSWNVSGWNMLEQTEVFRRIIAAAEPDLLLLDEVAPGLSADSVRTLLFGRGQARAEAWTVAYGTAGGRQRGVIAVRGGELEPAPGLARVEYPADLTNRLAGSRPRGFGGTRDGVPASGGVVQLSGRRLLAVTVDLQCCGNGAQTPEETIRLAEAGALASSIRAELASGGLQVDAVVVAGDLNLVGSVQPLALLASGSDLDGSDLAVAHPLDPRGLTDATWSGVLAARAFPPGRLDFLLYSDASLDLGRSFVLDTAELPARWLATYGLEPEDALRASDHFPLVTDLVWIEPDPGVP